MSWRYWSRSDKLAAAGVSLTLVAALLALTQPEVRRFLSLDPSETASEITESPSRIAPETPMPPSPEVPTEPPTEGPPQRPTEAPVSSPTPPLLPYEADWSSGMNGWVGSEDWKTVEGMLISNGGRRSQEISITAPISLEAIRDYVVEVDIQLIKYADEGSTSALNSFGLVVRAGEGNQGYGVGHCVSVEGLTFVPQQCAPDKPEVGAANASPGDLAPPPVYVALIQTADDENREVIAVAPFRPRGEWHHYRIEVKGNSIGLLIDDAGVVLSAVDNRYLEGDRVGLWSNGCQINVRNFKVTAV